MCGLLRVLISSLISPFLTSSRTTKIIYFPYKLSTKIIQKVVCWLCDVNLNRFSSKIDSGFQIWT